MSALRLILLTILLAGLLAPIRATALHLESIEFGAASDHHGQVLAGTLDARNTPGALAVTGDGALWFHETFAWHPRYARFGPDRSFREFRDPYAETALTDCYTVTHRCVDFDGDGFRPMRADGDGVLIGPLLDGATRIKRIASNGSISEVDARGCIAAGSGIACFSHSKRPIVFRPEFFKFGALPDVMITPNSVVAAHGGIWFTDTRHSQIGVLYPNGKHRLFVDGLTRWNSGPQFITLGPDGNLWFTEKRDRIGRILPNGTITEYHIGIPRRSSIGGIVSGPDGALWFTLYHGMVLGRISTDGRIHTYHDLVYPSDGNDNAPVGTIICDRAGRLYYNEGKAGRIARISIRP